MRAYASHDSARRRLQVRLQEHHRISLDDLLRYLEDVSSEPAGEEAYGLAVSIRSMGLPCEHLRSLLEDAQYRLFGSHRMDVAHESIRPRLADAARLLVTKIRQEPTADSNRGVPSEQDNRTRKTSQQPASDSSSAKDPELELARHYGYEISDSLRKSYKWHLFHNMAALALYWTIVKPSSNSSNGPSVWIEEDTIRMFP